MTTTDDTRPVALSPRLAAVLELTPAVAVAADIGTDHGYLPVAWLQAGRAQRAIAADLRAGPLAQAARTIAAAGLTDRIELRQGDGLTVLQPREAEVATIAGVGGTVMQGMLAAATPLPVRHLLLQPMNGWAGVRRQAATKGLALRQEMLVAEGERQYLVLRLERAESADATWQLPGLSATGAAALWEAGPLLYAQRDPLLYRWLTDRHAELVRLLEPLAAGRTAEAEARRQDISRHVAGLEELLQCW